MNIEEMIEKSTTILKNAQAIFDAMPDQSRIRLTDLATQACENTDIDPEDAMPFITWFAHNCDNKEMSIGRSGGLYKGSKPKSSRASKSISD